MLQLCVLFSMRPQFPARPSSSVAPVSEIEGSLRGGFSEPARLLGSSCNFCRRSYTLCMFARVSTHDSRHLWHRFLYVGRVFSLGHCVVCTLYAPYASALVFQAARKISRVFLSGWERTNRWQLQTRLFPPVRQTPGETKPT